MGSKGAEAGCQLGGFGMSVMAVSVLGLEWGREGSGGEEKPHPTTTSADWDMADSIVRCGSEELMV